MKKIILTCLFTFYTSASFSAAFPAKPSDSDLQHICREELPSPPGLESNAWPVQVDNYAWFGVITLDLVLNQVTVYNGDGTKLGLYPIEITGQKCGGSSPRAAFLPDDDPNVRSITFKLLGVGVNTVVTLEYITLNHGQGAHFWSTTVLWNGENYVWESNKFL